MVVNPELQPYFDGKDEIKSKIMAHFSKHELDGNRPKRKSQNEIERVFAARLHNILKPKNYSKLRNDVTYEPLRQFDWFNKAVERLLRKSIR